MTSRSRRLLGIVVLLALVGPIVVDLLWVTDEERVETALDALETALEARDADGVVAWFTEDVTVAHPIPSFPRGGTLAENVRVFLSQLSKFSFKRDETHLEFTDDGDVEVTTHGSGSCHLEERGPLGFQDAWFRFEMQFKLRRVEDRFLLESVERVIVKPPLG